MTGKQRRKERRIDRRRGAMGRVEHVKDSYTVSHMVGPGVTESVMARLFDYFNEYEAYSAESVMQCDDAESEAASVLADIAEDILCFKVKYDD